MNKRVIINADDFGLCSGVNRAIAQAHIEGVLRSATIMANMPGAQEAVEIAKANRSLGIGVHLNLSEGRPLSKNNGMDALLDGDGQFACSAFRLFALCLAGRRIRMAIRAELAAQIRWVIDMGLRPTHLDSHKHIHALPAVFRIVCELARDFGIGAVRWTFEPRGVCRPPWPAAGEGGRKRAGLIRPLARINRMQEPGLLKTNAFFGIAHTGKIDISFFKAVTLYNSAAIVEVMTHPGYADGLDPDKTRLVDQRKAELDALCSERTKQYFRDAKIELVHYGQL
jgi:hopanoid biosynthesis associated protein HpnK